MTCCGVNTRERSKRRKINENQHEDYISRAPTTFLSFSLSAVAFIKGIIHIEKGKVHFKLFFFLLKWLTPMRENIWCASHDEKETKSGG